MTSRLVRTLVLISEYKSLGCESQKIHGLTLHRMILEIYSNHRKSLFLPISHYIVNFTLSADSMSQTLASLIKSSSFAPACLNTSDISWTRQGFMPSDALSQHPSMRQGLFFTQSLQSYPLWGIFPLFSRKLYRRLLQPQSSPK